MTKLFETLKEQLTQEEYELLEAMGFTEVDLGTPNSYGELIMEINKAARDLLKNDVENDYKLIDLEWYLNVQKLTNKIEIICQNVDGLQYRY